MILLDNRIDWNVCAANRAQLDLSRETGLNQYDVNGCSAYPFFLVFYDAKHYTGRANGIFSDLKRALRLPLGGLTCVLNVSN